MYSLPLFLHENVYKFYGFPQSIIHFSTWNNYSKSYEYSYTTHLNACPTAAACQVFCEDENHLPSNAAITQIVCLPGIFYVCGIKYSVLGLLFRLLQALKSLLFSLYMSYENVNICQYSLYLEKLCWKCQRFTRTLIAFVAITCLNFTVTYTFEFTL